jgi:hypothetical protein
MSASENPRANEEPPRLSSRSFPCKANRWLGHRPGANRPSSHCVGPRLGLLAVFACFIGTKLTGALVATVPAAVDPRGDEEIRIQQIFTSHLPDTMRESDLRLWIHPHFGDLIDGDYLRSRAGVRYGLTRWWEIGASADIYFSHGIGDTRFGDRYGLAGFQLATKFNFGLRHFLGWDTAVGADIDIPVGHPPAEVTDGMRHYGPWATFSRRWDARPFVRIFWGVGADLVRQTDIAGTHGRNQFLDNNARATSGVVVDRGRLHYTFEVAVASNRIIGSGHDDVVTIRPGIIWEVPPRHDSTEKRNLLIGAGLSVQSGPHGTSFGGSLKFRYNVDLKALFGARRANWP